jgi:hypothetical protein
MAKPGFTFRYKVRNWPEYNRALVRRGHLTLWIDEAALATWLHTEHGARCGRPRIYADVAIECALVLKAVFHLSLRATQGFLESVFRLMELELPVPDYSTLSRRQTTLDVSLPVGRRKLARHIVIDATGLKVYGAGEWQLRKHGTMRRRTWRKLHRGVDEATKEVVAVDVTASRVHDSRRLPKLLAMVPGPIGQVSGDRAYDTQASYESVLNCKAVPTLAPRRNARCTRGPDPPPWRAVRDATIRAIGKHGRYGWRVSSGCTRQSVAENAVSRFKALFGGRLFARTFENQHVEASVKCAAMNRMTALGMPESGRVL